MAIEKTFFTETTQAALAPEVYAFLNANKDGYFDSVVMDETSRNISCYVGETPALVLGFNGTVPGVKITLANGAYYNGYMERLYWKYAVKTSKGLALYTPYNTVYITKTNDGTTAILFHGQNSSSQDDLCYQAGDIVHGSALYEFAYTRNAILQAGLTVFAPVSLGTDVESYTPDVYITPYTQYCAVVSKLTANGREYYYNGYIALGD